MSPEGQPSDVGAPEEADSPAELFEWVDKFRNFKKFRATRDAILAGEQLSDYRKKELKEHHYLGPWLFNLFQSTISGLPALAIQFCAHLLGLSQGMMLGGARGSSACPPVHQTP
jgi:hypothetical protein